MALESAASNKEIFDVMRAGKDALKVATANTDVDKVADVMEDISEVSSQQNSSTMIAKLKRPSAHPTLSDSFSTANSNGRRSE